MDYFDNQNNEQNNSLQNESEEKIEATPQKSEPVTKNPTESFNNGESVQQVPPANQGYQNQSQVQPQPQQQRTVGQYPYSYQNGQTNQYRYPNTQPTNPQTYEYSPNNLNNQPVVVPPQPIKKSKKGIIIFASIIAGCLTLVFLLLAAAIYNNASLDKSSAKNDSSNNSSSSSAPVITIEDNEKSSNNEEVTNNMSLTAQIADKVAPSVVAITIKIDQRGYSSAAAGSGIIVSEDGYIATNYHVVEYADTYPKYTSISVMLDDGTEYDAKYIAGDSKNDIAVIKIDAKDLPAAQMGNSDKLSRGEFVMAIGNPLGEYLEGSVSLGVVSATGRTGIDDTAVAYIQTDAAINPGNSGGPLINMDGQVVGINTAKVVLEGYEGIGFAIPSSFAVNVINELISTGKAPSYAFIGIEYVEVNESTASYYNLPQGLRIINIYEQSKVDTSKVQKGDIIVAADGQDITSATDISKILASKKPGDTIKLTIFHPENGTGTKFDTEVTLISNNDVEESEDNNNYNNYNNNNNNNNGNNSFFDFDFGY
jgi:serine protease Do